MALRYRSPPTSPTRPPAVTGITNGRRRPLVLSSWLLGLLLSVTTVAQPAGDQRSMLRSIEDAEALLQERERSTNPLDLALIEPLRSLAELHLSAGRLNTAESLLNRQLEIQRVNGGLHSAAQIPVLESLIRIQIARRDWEGARDSISNLVWIHTRTDDINAGEQLAGMQRARAWLMLLLQRDATDREARHLLMYRKVSEQMQRLTEERFDENDMRQLPYLFEASRADLAIALTIMQNPLTGQALLERMEGIRSRPIRPGYTITSVAELEAAYGSKVDTVAERSFRRYMRDHSSMLDRMREIAEANDDAEAHAMLTVYRGDATLMRQQYEHRTGRLAGPQRGRGSLGTAVTHYRDAFEQLRALGHDNQSLMERFGCPSLLPMDTLFLKLQDYPVCARNEEGDPQLATDAPLLGSKLPGFSYELPMLPGERQSDIATGTFAVDIGHNGQIANSDVVEAFPEEAAHRAEIRRLMANLQFRPALEPDGGATRTENLLMVMQLEADN